MSDGDWEYRKTDLDLSIGALIDIGLALAFIAGIAALAIFG